MGALQIDVLGASFAIQANEDSAYLKKLLDYYKRIAEQIEASGSLKNSLQVAILTGITLCDELYKEKSKKQQIASQLVNDDGGEAERLTIEMIKKIDQALS
ncbi:MAG: cell division protein ZapA [Treponemataceae bacterium]|nr:cell division protein ZapA [Treponemataceae bacterium]MDE7228088.1 cell division protein ZapA [Treponemataceae bacterium]MDE7391649.1 cell division protein ZapA [Treponemataceae bacterium]